MHTTSSSAFESLSEALASIHEEVDSLRRTRLNVMERSPGGYTVPAMAVAEPKLNNKELSKFWKAIFEKIASAKETFNSQSENLKITGGSVTLSFSPSVAINFEFTPLD